MSGRLIVMGSGEISPTMVSTHRWGLEKSGQNTVTVVDTPYGFQENAEELTEKIVQFFQVSLQAETVAASLRSAAAPASTRESFLADIFRAGFLFAGPGSPTYALSIWRDVGFGELAEGILAAGGTVVMASAAALTVGVKTIPVYEIYKVGAEPCWEEGLDLTSQFGLPMVVVPHWNNAEGGTHDTSHCYIGERRFDALVDEIDVGVMGVDEHTAAAIDFAAGELTVSGVGSVTLLGQRQKVIESGSSVGLDEVADVLAEGYRSPRSQVVADHTNNFDDLLAAGDVDGALDMALEWEDQVAHGSLESHPLLRQALARFARLAETGVRDESEGWSELIELAVRWRQDARHSGEWAAADKIRDVLARSGVELRDTPTGTEWVTVNDDSQMM